MIESFDFINIYWIIFLASYEYKKAPFNVNGYKENNTWSYEFKNTTWSNNLKYKSFAFLKFPDFLHCNEIDEKWEIFSVIDLIFC